MIFFAAERRCRVGRWKQCKGKMREGGTRVVSFLRNLLWKEN